MDASPSSNAGWTNEEKLSLLISVIAAGGPIDWAKVELPRGRSRKSCMHVVDNTKRVVSGSSTEKASKQGETATQKRKRSSSAETKDAARKASDEDATYQKFAPSQKRVFVTPKTNRFIDLETDEEARTVSSFFSTGQRVEKHADTTQNPAPDADGAEDDGEEPADENEEEEVASSAADTSSSNGSEDGTHGYKVTIKPNPKDAIIRGFTPINTSLKIENDIYQYTPHTPRKSDDAQWLKRTKLTPQGDS